MATSPDAMTPLQPPRLVRVVNPLNVRNAPRLDGLRVDRLERRQEVRVDGVVRGDAFLGQSIWFRVAGREQFFWSGGVEMEEAPAAAAGAPSAAGAILHRRANGTILPLDTAGIARAFGSFQTRPAAQRGAVVITTDSWLENLVPLEHPVIAGVLQHAPRVHARARPYFAAALDAIQQAGLADRILTCDGTFVPRHKNWDPAATLSSHSWGIAIDFNARWNGAGCQPALPGQTGCVRDLVPFFEAQGFAWGGHFSSNVDGMHFELARENP